MSVYLGDASAAEAGVCVITVINIYDNARYTERAETRGVRPDNYEKSE